MIEQILTRDRLLTLAGTAVICLLAWVYTLAGVGMGMTAAEMTAMTPAVGQPGMNMPAPVWSPFYAVIVVAMWWVMMVAMMLPSATPMILVFASVARQRKAGSALAVSAFVGGYLVVWAFFSVAATTAQWLLATSGLISPMLASETPWLAGGLLCAAGLYQLTPFKHRCLSHCRTPAGFVASHWRPGNVGALRMGIQHGYFCLGCCWILMALLFAGGVMNLYWIAGLAVFVLLEKTLPRGHWLGLAAGVVLLAWGVEILAWGGQR